MNDKEYIKKLVKKHKGKMNAVRMTKSMVLCISAGFLAALLVEIYSFIKPFFYADLVAIILIAVSAVVGIALGIMKKIGDRDAALDIDSAGFRERIVTAYEGLDKDGPIYELQRKDAVKVARAGEKSIRVKREGLPKLVCIFTFLFAAVITSMFLPSKTKARAKELHKIGQKVDQKKDDVDDLKDELEKLKDELSGSLTEDEKKKLEQMIESLEASKQELDKAETEEEYQAAKDKLDFKYDDINQRLNDMANAKEKIDNDPESAERMREAAAEAANKKEDNSTEQNTGSGQPGGTDTQQPGGSTDTQQPGSGTDTQEPGGGTDTQQPGGGTDTQQPGSGTDTQQPGGGTDTQQPGGGTDTQEPGGGGDQPGGGNQPGDQPGGGVGRGEGTAHNDHDYVSIPGNDNVNVEGNGNGSGDSGYGSTNNGPAWSGNHVNYEEVIGEYEKTAYEGIESGKYPPGMEDVIKDYFGNLLED